MKTAYEGIFKIVRWVVAAVSLLIIVLPALASVSTI
jgi:hypothetical protein